jgi:hypothetical protein
VLLDDPGRVRSQITNVVCQIQRFDFDYFVHKVGGSIRAGGIVASASFFSCRLALHMVPISDLLTW